ncbi:MAG: SEL1-like repeat protein [Acidobacteriota bacterium]|nr:SEL1-like repeat protein [Acidobacteriota bacterium]
MRGISQSWSGDSYDPGASGGLFVGTRDFEDPLFREIPFAVDDAVDLAYLFSCDLGLISPQRVRLALSGTAQKEVSRARHRSLREAGAQDSPTTRNGLLNEALRLSEGTGRNGILVTAFATHGFSEGGIHRLVAANSVRREMRDTGVDVPKIKHYLETSPCRRRILILDACQEVLNDENHRGSTTVNAHFLDALSQSEGLVHLVAAGYGGRAYDDLRLGNGVFTEAILRGLRGEAPPAENGFITFATLVDFVKRCIEESPYFGGSSKDRPRYASQDELENIPLVSADPEEVQRRRWRERKELAGWKLRDNVGSVIRGGHLEEILQHLSAQESSAPLLELLQRIEELDGKQRSQESFLFFYQHRWRGPEEAEPDRFQRGLEHMYGISGKVDLAAAREEFEAWAGADDAVGRMWLAWLRRQGFCGYRPQPGAARELRPGDGEETLRRAGEGESGAQLVWGAALTDGVGVERDPDEALEWCRRAADQGNSLAMVFVGFLLTGGRSQSQDAEAAFRWFQRADEAGNGAGARNLGFAYLKGCGVEVDVELGLQHYRRAAEMGDVSAMITLGDQYEYGREVAKDLPAARDWYRRAAEGGNAKGMSYLGALLLGKGERGLSDSDRDSQIAEGLRWLERSVEAEDIFGLRYLGALYADGDAVAQDYGRTVELWKRAAKLGDGFAMEFLAQLFENGEGVEQDFATARSWYRRAAEAGRIAAMVQLGKFLQEGTGGPAKPEEAVVWFTKAAEGNDLEALFQLALCYGQGIGVEQSGTLASSYLKQAQLGGHPRAGAYNIIDILTGSTQDKATGTRKVLADLSKKFVDWLK